VSRTVVALGAAASLLAAGACSSSGSTSGLQPITAIVIPAQTITSGRGCGSDPSRIFKYAAVVSGSAPLFGVSDAGLTKGVAGGVYDCFVDAVFSSLPTGTDGEGEYTIDVLAMNAAQYDAQRGAVDTAGQPGGPLDLRKFQGLHFVCNATLRLSVASTAVCQPAQQPGDGGTSDAAKDGGVDAPNDASASDAHDASDASDAPDQ
jgi:hypothetical protein